MKFRNVCKVKKQLVEPGLVWSRTLSIPLSMNGESVSLPVFALRIVDQHFKQFYCSWMKLNGGKLCQKYSYQKLSKSDNWFSSYSRKCRGCFFWDAVYKAALWVLFVHICLSRMDSLTLKQGAEKREQCWERSIVRAEVPIWRTSKGSSYTQLAGRPHTAHRMSTFGLHFRLFGLI